jgi:chromate transporter
MAEAAAHETDLPRPASAAELFRVFTRLSLLGFGGVLPIAQHELVVRQRWLSKAQFVELLGLGQVLPGPNIVNVALMLGDRYFGWRGALAAVGGLLLLPWAIVLALAVLYQEFASMPTVAGALRGMGAVAAGLVLAMALRLVGALKANPLGMPLCAAFVLLTALGIGLLRWPMAWVILGLGPVALLAATWRLRSTGQKETR